MALSEEQKRASGFSHFIGKMPYILLILRKNIAKIASLGVFRILWQLQDFKEHIDWEDTFVI